VIHKVESFGISDIGLIRQNNEDVWAQIPEKYFYALADGMGGHKAGEVAAFLATEAVCEAVEKAPSLDATLLKKAIVEANQKIYHLSTTQNTFTGMGTTLCCCLLKEKELICAHVGDSRIYRYRKGLKRLTKDHSLREDLLAKGQIKEEDLATFPKKNVITKAIGLSLHVEPEISSAEIEPGDIYFLCSDGLTDGVSDPEIASIIETSPSIEEASKKLVSLAKAKGGSDNITILMLKITN